jgi:hypothetical protein
MDYKRDATRCFFRQYLQSYNYSIWVATLDKPVYWIRDILRRIRILGTGHWITDPDPTPALFVSGFKMARKKVFLLSVLLGSHTLVFKEVIKQLISRLFLIFCFLVEGSVQTITTDPDPYLGGPNPTDPAQDQDPEH